MPLRKRRSVFDRLALDHVLDPGQLVGPEDLPTWLGGLERTNVAVEQVSIPTAMSSTASTVPLAIEAEPYDGVDAPQPDVIDVEVNGLVCDAESRTRSSSCCSQRRARRLYLS
ncbi:MAG: hypothetical protein R2848_09465 [Thermomicrobiales bacterium]